MELRNRTILPSPSTPVKKVGMDKEEELSVLRKQVATLRKELAAANTKLGSFEELKVEMENMKQQLLDMKMHLQLANVIPIGADIVQQIATQLEGPIQQFVTNQLKKTDGKLEEKMKETDEKLEKKMVVYANQISEMASMVSKEIDTNIELGAVQIQATENAVMLEEMRKQVARTKEELAKMQQMNEPYNIKIQGLQRDINDNKIAIEELQKRVAVVSSDVQEGKVQQATFKTALLSGTMEHKASSPRPPVVANATNQCVIKAPRGLIQGWNAAARAKAFNTKVVAKLDLEEGNFACPEATALVSIGANNVTKNGAKHDNEMWLATFNSPSDVSKMFAYKKQLKNKCPDVYVQPSFTKEERAKRTALWKAGYEFRTSQESSSATPTLWNQRFISNFKIELKGPNNGLRYVVLDDTGSAKIVVAEDGNGAGQNGGSKVSKGKSNK